MMPAMISSTTAGTRMLGKNPRSMGAATAIAATITRFVNETSGIDPFLSS
jgi:hypothetical protein